MNSFVKNRRMTHRELADAIAAAYEATDPTDRMQTLAEIKAMLDVEISRLERCPRMPWADWGL